MPGIYKVSISQWLNGKIVQLVKPTSFKTKVLRNTTLPAKNRRALVEFQLKLAELSRVLQGSYKEARELNKKIIHIKQTIIAIPGGITKLLPLARDIENQLDKIIFAMRGHTPKASREEIPPTHVPLISRLYALIYAQSRSTSSPGKSQFTSYNIIVEELAPLLSQLKKIVQKDIPALEKELENAKAPWTPGRILKLQK